MVKARKLVIGKRSSARPGEEARVFAERWSYLDTYWNAAGEEVEVLRTKKRWE